MRVTWSKLVFAMALAAVLAALAVTVPRPAPAASAVEPARIFADDVLARRRAGWRLVGADLEYADQEHGQTTLTLVMASDSKAERFAVRFDPETRRIVGYDRQREKAPAERRVYRDEAALYEALAHEDFTTLETECGLVVMGGSNTYVAVGEYWVVEETATGEEAREAMARWLASELRGGRTLASTAGEDGAFDLVLEGEGRVILHATFDEAGPDAGWITSFEARRAPGYGAYRSIAGGERLAAALGQNGQKGKPREIRSLRVAQGDGEVRITVSLSKGKSVVIDPADYRDLDEYEGCGC